MADTEPLYEKCQHCHLFVEPDDMDDTAFVHLHRGDPADEALDVSHQPAPSGRRANLATWQTYGPLPMRERFTFTPEPGRPIPAPAAPAERHDWSLSPAQCPTCVAMATKGSPRHPDGNLLPATALTGELRQFLCDAVTTAVEGGINAWADIMLYRWWSPDLPGGTGEHRSGQPNAYALIREDPELEESSDPRWISVNLLDAAFRHLSVTSRHVGLAASNKQRLLTAYLTNNEDSLFDADDADSIVQYAIFGEVQYG